jgi:hypothetical protein
MRKLATDLRLKHDEAEYGRLKRVWLQAATCDGCGESNQCLHADASDDEYGPVVLCRRCAAGVFKLPAFVPPPPEPRTEPSAPAVTLDQVTAILKNVYPAGWRP